MLRPPAAMTFTPSTEIIYPESDGQPMADNTVQFRLMVMIQGGIDAWFKDNPDVFVAGDLFWYPVEGEPWVRQAPDVMAVFGRPKGDRRSYKQWEENNIAPQVVFEIASKSNTKQELQGSKQRFYQRYGVEEYYVFDPDRGRLDGWQRSGNALRPIPTMPGWISPRLGVRFEQMGKQLYLYRPDGERFATYVEIVEQREQEHQRAEQEHQRAEQEHQRAEQEHQRAEQEHQRAEQIERTQQEAIPRLLAMGLSVEQIAEALSLSVEAVRSVSHRPPSHP